MKPIFRLLIVVPFLLLAGSCAATAQPVEAPATVPAAMIPTAPVTAVTTTSTAPAPTQTVHFSTPIHIADREPTITPTPLGGQPDDSVPTCLNPGIPQPVRNISAFSGTLVYANDDRTIWQTLSGSPPVSSPLRLPAPVLDSLAVSPGGKLALLYQNLPIQKQADHATFWKYSPGYPPQSVDVAMSPITHYVRKNAGTYGFQHWTLRFITERIILVDATYSETPKMGFPPHTYAFFDVEKQTWWDDLISELPDREPYYWLEVSPDLKHVLYINSDFKLVLWDRGQKQVVWTWDQRAESEQTQFEASWSPDSQNVAFGGYREVEILSMKDLYLRAVRRLTFSSTPFDYHWNNYQWSPDSRSVAFIAALNKDQEDIWYPILYVYDLKTDTYTYKCQIGEPGNASLTNADIRWSPDGKYIATSGKYSSIIPMSIEDLVNHTVFQIQNTEYSAMVWVSAFPLK